MKKGRDCLVNKYVYHLIDDTYYCRIDYHGTKLLLAVEFPTICRIAKMSSSFKVCMFVQNREITAWIDKYSNVVVRVIDYNVKQTKIDF